MRGQRPHDLAIRAGRVNQQKEVVGATCEFLPMIDVYAPAGTFRDRATLARDLATAVMTIERVPNIPLFRQNTAAFVHELLPDTLSNVDGDHACACRCSRMPRASTAPSSSRWSPS